MKTQYILMALWALMTVVLPTPARGGGGGFTPGHVFVSITSPDPCDFGGSEGIAEIDPVTGAISLFADSDDGLCLVNGLRFTPDGSQLYALNLGHLLPEFDGGWVQAFNPDGTSEVVLDASDGIFGPNGANGLAFDAHGNLYVVNAEVGTILKFPADGGPATVFADLTDGLAGRGALDFAPNGDLFYCGDFAGAIIRITPEGESSVFDTLPAPSSLVFDAHGNLFVGAGQAGVGTTFYRYDNGDPNSRRILAQGFKGQSGVPSPVALSADGSVLYVVQANGFLFAIDAEDGTTTLVATIGSVLGGRPHGIAVYAPEPIPATSEWGILLMTLLLLTGGTLLLSRGSAHETHGSQTRAVLRKRSFGRKVMKAQRSNVILLGAMCTASLYSVRPAMGECLSHGDPELCGKWGQVIPVETWKIEAVHMILLKTGNLLVFDEYFGDVRVWDRATETMRDSIALPLDSAGLAIPLFCAGHAQLPDGRVVLSGGGEGYSEAHEHTVIFDPDAADPSDPWIDADDMPTPPGAPNGKRWYPTNTTMGDGKIMVLTGDIFGPYPHTADVPLIFDASKDWQTEDQYTELPNPNPPWQHLPYYPFVFQLSDGSMLYAGSRIADEAVTTELTAQRLTENPGDGTFSWIDVDSTPKRAWSAVMYGRDRIMKGGGRDMTEYGCGRQEGTTYKKMYTLDLTSPNPQWDATMAELNTARQHLYLVPLPDGKILAACGCNTTGDVAHPELYDPGLDEWKDMVPMATGLKVCYGKYASGIYCTADADCWTCSGLNGLVCRDDNECPQGQTCGLQQSNECEDALRTHHATALLLPDARVIVAGTRFDAQIFSPPYLFNANGPICDDDRPKIDSVTSPESDVMYYGRGASIRTGSAMQAASIDSVVLIRLGSATHGFDQDTRFVKLTKNYVPLSDTVTVVAPANGNEAPPGYYMLFIVNNSGVPSLAKIIALDADCDNNGVFDRCDLSCESSDCDQSTCGGSVCDCNRNNVPDVCDIANGTSADTTGQPGEQIPDECEVVYGCDDQDTSGPFCVDCTILGVDCNDNDTADECEICRGDSHDCDVDGVPDDCQVPPPGGTCTTGCKSDCNANGVPDECDPNCNNNLFPDDCDITQGTSLDCNGNGVPDECEADCNSNNVADECDITDCNGTWQCADCNGNGIPDECDPNCNGNDPPDDCAISECDGSEWCADCQCNGIPDGCDITTGQSYDCDNNNVPDECQAPAALALPSGAAHQASKHRYISIESDANQQCVALKVTLTSMKRCSGLLSRACGVLDVDDDCEDSVPGSGTCVEHPDLATAGPWWVQPPGQEPLGCIPGPCGDEDWFARVGSTRYFDRWTLRTLHIGDCEIIPVATYEIRACLPPYGTICSDALSVPTIAQPFLSPGFRGNYGDVAGPVDPVTGNYTVPDGLTNVVDVSAYILTEQNYGTANKPQTHPTWVDLHGLGDGNPPQYILNVSDLGQILKAFAGDAWTDDPGNLNPGQCTNKSYSRDPGGVSVTFTLVAKDDLIDPTEAVVVDVYIDSPSSVDVGAYEVRLEVTGGISGDLCLQEAKVIKKLCAGGTDDGEPCTTAGDCAAPGTCDPRPDYIFGEETAVEARSLVTKQLSNAKEAGGVSVQGQKYLATYTFQPCNGATGVFNISVKEDYDLSFLNDSAGVLLASTGGETQVVGVGVDCLTDAHCGQIACQTGTCINNACVYDNAPQGTPCDDGLFCTLTDECDGNGACVGTGDKCTLPRNPECCESEDRCYNPGNPPVYCD